MLHADITGFVLNRFYKVYNKLGFGFLEKVYEKALFYELEKSGLTCDRQRKIEVFYEGIHVGEYYADIIINDKVILELKAAEGIRDEHEAQLTNYLKASNMEVGMLLNFGKKPQHKRVIFTNDRKELPY